MNNTFKKRIDELGRIVIPKQIRDSFKIKEFDELELSIEDDSIIVTKTCGILNIKEKLDNFLIFIKKYLNLDVIILSNNKVVSSNVDKVIFDDEVEYDFDNNHIEFKNDISINKDNIKSYNLILDSNSYGYIVFVLKDSKDYQATISDIIKIILDMLK